ncbi:hypothetical protein [Kolteria novifilia]|uniref:hypothetical protein n=1 Tax=Kolteria novifilia TaxID=2527975 RepID=UPI003AF37353
MASRRSIRTFGIVIAVWMIGLMVAAMLFRIFGEFPDPPAEPSPTARPQATAEP